jgi:hypothetical protein
MTSQASPRAILQVFKSFGGQLGISSPVGEPTHSQPLKPIKGVKSRHSILVTKGPVQLDGEESRIRSATGKSGFRSGTALIFGTFSIETRVARDLWVAISLDEKSVETLYDVQFFEFYTTYCGLNLD